jgi:hypothetical protein
MNWGRIQERIDDGLHDRLRVADFFGTRMRRDEEAALKMNDAIVDAGRRILEQQINDLEDVARAAPAAAAKLSEALETLTLEPKGHPAGALRAQERALTQALALHAKVDIAYYVEGLRTTVERASRFRELEADVARARPHLQQDELVTQSLADLGERLSAALAETDLQWDAYTSEQSEQSSEWLRPWLQNPHDWLVDSGPG